MILQAINGREWLKYFHELQHEARKGPWDIKKPRETLVV
jgi:hypothetical protein